MFSTLMGFLSILWIKVAKDWVLFRIKGTIIVQIELKAALKYVDHSILEKSSLYHWVGQANQIFKWKRLIIDFSTRLGTWPKLLTVVGLDAIYKTTFIGTIALNAIQNRIPTLPLQTSEEWIKVAILLGYRRKGFWVSLNDIDSWLSNPSPRHADPSGEGRMQSWSSYICGLEKKSCLQTSLRIPDERDMLRSDFSPFKSKNLTAAYYQMIILFTTTYIGSEPLWKLSPLMADETAERPNLGTISLWLCPPERLSLLLHLTC